MGPVTDEHKLTYKANFELVVQQKTSRFEQAFTYQSDLKGRQAQIIDLIGTTTAIIDGNRGGDTPNIDNQTEPVWAVPHQIEWGKLIEKEDAIKALTDFQSPFVQAGGAAIVRGRDSVFASAIFADRKIGQDGSSTSSYDATAKVVADSVGSTAATGMNLAKIQRTKRYLRAFQVDLDMEDLWGVLNAQEMEELYNDIIAASTTPQGKMAVLDADKKAVHSVSGVSFVNYESMTNYDGSTYTAAIWCKSGMHYGDFSPLETRAEPNPAKKFRIQCYAENWWGSTRSEDKKVIKVLNKI
jgi:hypothetical protein